MALKLIATPWVSSPFQTLTLSSKSPTISSNTRTLLILLLSRCISATSPLKPTLKSFNARASLNGEMEAQEPISRASLSTENEPSFLDEDLLRRASVARDAREVLSMISEKYPNEGGVIGASDCSRIIGMALKQSNTELAFSVFSAMRGNFTKKKLGEVNEDEKELGSSVECWKWAPPDVNTYATLVRGLAASLCVSDAIRTITDVSRAGLPYREEVHFGQIVKCPTCTIAIAVAQPQHGIQIASCSKCRYQYDLVSGHIVSIDSEAISTDISPWDKALRLLQIIKKSIPAAVHSIVVQTPSGIAQTHRFSTKTVDLPAQEGQRVTIASAPPSNIYRELGPFKLRARIPGFDPGEPISITNHTSGVQSELLRAPAKNKVSSLLDPPILLLPIALLATGDAASGILDPTLPRVISIAAASSIILGTTINTIILPRLNQLPQRSADAIAIRQQLLAQHDMLQTRMKELSQAAEREVWMLARMCQLENKILAVGEPSYRARRSRILKVRESLENSLLTRIGLIDSYARISSMIEIEVEMNSDVLAAEAVSNAENIAEQIEHMMELENLEERWRMQAEANDELEKLLNSQPMSTEPV
ncbi:uncharacterized protein LOC18439265 [Amborella trichopoda]|uniref:uncharacterized protein LOC18439265 n=1 Tax=Amborella trichopoda TaxID=13333 RepID=UPI0005D45C7A|nr:uncharacterized protein LOC18439265 [Amborella trichopoda]|eukprot:XP_011625265.1 uncharacterized protein LOC18439265 [Amborella trichopoda]